MTDAPAAAAGSPARRFRPSLWPTVFTIPAVLMMLALGTWQVQRLFWKEALIAERQSRITAAPIALPWNEAEAQDTEFRRVRLTGSFLHDREMYLAARALNGVVGYQVMTPFRLEDGRFVLVNRGWIPDKDKDPASRAAGQLTGTVTIEGAIRRSGVKSWFTPDNDPQRNMWFYVDLDAMAAHAALNGPVSPVFVEADATKNPGGLPIGGQTRVQLPNDHLQYAITWYSLAIALIVIYVIYHWRPALPEDGRPRDRTAS